MRVTLWKKPWRDANRIERANRIIVPLLGTSVALAAFWGAVNLIAIVGILTQDFVLNVHAYAVIFHIGAIPLLLAIVVMVATFIAQERDNAKLAVMVPTLIATARENAKLGKGVG